MALDSAKLRASIESITDLPTLPTVVGRITQRISNPATNAADVGKLIEQDQALTGKVLRLVNSAYYGFPKQIKSIQHAVVILGFNKIKTIIITASVFGAFSGSNSDSLNLEHFWQHSLATAIASKATAELIGVGHAAEDAFIGGLMHDVGKVVMDQFQPAIYNPILKYARDKGILLVKAEKEVMGLTHAEVGEWMMERWRLPPVLVQMIGAHHHPNSIMDRREIVTAIHLGDIFARALCVGNAGDGRIPEIDATAIANHNIDAAFCDRVISRTVKEMEKAEEFFSLISSGA